MLELYLTKPEVYANAYPLQTVWGMQYWRFMGMDTYWGTKKQENRLHDTFVERYGNEAYWENFKKDQLSAKGCSYDDPVYDKYGKVDKAASRRVVFQFRLKVK